MIFAAALAGCASGTNVAAGSGIEQVSAPVKSSEPAAPPVGDAAARAQAQAWLEAANLPPGAVRTETPSGSFNSYTGWPCGPYEELEGYWVIPNMTVLDAMIAVGGLNQYAAGNRAKLIRYDRKSGKQTEYALKLSSLLKDGDPNANVMLQPGDVIIIPESMF